jgi:pimeloyl-ACP methyl ester carboxylesterase
MMKKIIVLITIINVILIQNSLAQSKVYKPRIVFCDCNFKIDSSYLSTAPSNLKSDTAFQLNTDPGIKTRCGYLIVPENRTKASSRMIKLPFIIVQSKHPDKKKSPVLFTGGGPGSSSLGWANGIAKSDLILDRDCIAFEQRGTKYAIPYLRSFELDAAIKESYRKNLSKDSMAIEGVKRYKKRLEEKGIDLSGYNTDETVADIDDLLKTLQIDSVNLFGGSYSGGLMLAVLQKDPARVRSLVLNSPLPTFIHIDEDEPANLNEALNILFDRLDADPAEKKLYGNLKEKFQGYFTSIANKKFYIPYVEKGTTKTLNIQYTKNELLDIIEQNMLDYSKVKDVPFIISEMIKGKHDVYIKEKLDDIFNKNTAPDGMRISVYCADQSAYHDEGVIHQLYKLYPYMKGYHINDVYKSMCDCWNVPPVKPETKQPFYSAKPVLIGDGEMDPACRPLYMKMIQHYMPNAQCFIFPNRTHMVGGKSFNDMILRFLNNPFHKLESDDKEVVRY